MCDDPHTEKQSKQANKQNNPRLPKTITTTNKTKQNKTQDSLKKKFRWLLTLFMWHASHLGFKPKPQHARSIFSFQGWGYRQGLTPTRQVPCHRAPASACVLTTPGFLEKAQSVPVCSWTQNVLLKGIQAETQKKHPAIVLPDRLEFSNCTLTGKTNACFKSGKKLSEQKFIY